MRGNARARTIPDYVDTLDGFRTIAIMLVVIYHYWQQSWQSMAIKIGSFKIDLLPLVSFGGVGVELMFILSGFCLYYPLAMHEGRRLHLGQYACKRIVRILPTYLLCVLVCSAWQVGRIDASTLKQHLIANLTFTQTTTPALSYNQINGVLWSVAVEVQFYILFPLIVKIFKKKPYLTALAAFAVSQIWRYYLTSTVAVSSSNWLTLNWLMQQLPCVLDAFVGGMLAAHIAAGVRHSLSEDVQKKLRPMFTVGLIGCILFYLLITQYVYALRYDDVANNVSKLDLYMRKYVTFAFAGAILCSIFSSPWVHRVLGNAFTRFGSTISYQVFLWHMFIALALKDLKIPSYTTERAMDDTAWRMPYLMLCLALTLIVSVLVTYLIEKPVAGFCLRHAPRRARAEGETTN